MRLQSPRCSELIHGIFGDERSALKLPWFNRVVMAYVAVTILTYILFQIAPFVTVLASTPLYSIKTYLGFLGALLLVIDLFTNKVLWRGKHCWALYGICVAALLSSLRTISYGVKDNLFDLCWVVIQFALIYSCAYRADREQMKKYVGALFVVIAVIWVVCCGISIWQYLEQVGYCYVSNPNSDNPELTRQGFLENRLFGIFVLIDYAVYISLTVLIGCVHYFCGTRKLWLKAILAVSAVIVTCHMILSGSRSVQIAALLYVFCLSWFLLRNRLADRKGLGKTVLCIVFAGCVTGACYLGYLGMKSGLAVLPAAYAQLKDSQGTTEGVEPEAPVEDELPENAILPEETPEDILKREDMEDVSNGRFEIWKDYLSLHDEIGLLGLSLSNYNDYIGEYHQDMYIVQYFDEYEEAGKTDLVFECHNNYLFVFVATGYLGLLLFAAFAVLTAVKVIRYILDHPKLSMSFISTLAVICIGCVQAVFMNSVFLKLNGPSFVFWFLLGILNRMTACEEKK